MTDEPRIGHYIDDEERELIESFEGSTEPLVNVLTPERKREIEAMARATLEEECAEIQLQVSKSDLTRLKSLALQDGLPWQTLAASLIHKYVTSR